MGRRGATFGHRSFVCKTTFVYTILDILSGRGYILNRK